ncbi:MAG: hypothetical protein WCP70_03340 [Methanothrix sp.]
MDLNLTGTIAANLTSMVAAKTDYAQLYSQIVTATVTLVAVFLAQYLNSRSEKVKREEEKKKKWLEGKRLAYHKFIEVISQPIDESKSGANYIIDISLKAASFGNVNLLAPVNVDLKDNDGNNYQIIIQSLNDFIGSILKIKYQKEANLHNQSSNLETLRETAAANFCPLFLNFLTEEYAKKTGGNQD